MTIRSRLSALFAETSLVECRKCNVLHRLEIKGGCFMIFSHWIMTSHIICKTWIFWPSLRKSLQQTVGCSSSKLLSFCTKIEQCALSESSISTGQFLIRRFNSWVRKHKKRSCMLLDIFAKIRMMDFLLRNAENRLCWYRKVTVNESLTLQNKNVWTFMQAKK